MTAAGRCVVTLPAVNRVASLGAYVRAVRAAKAEPATTFRHGLDTDRPTTGAEVLAQFRRGIHGRISEGIPYLERGQRQPALLGRKLEAGWQAEVYRLARKVNERRLIVREAEVPAEFRIRLRHRLHDDDDF